MVCKKEVNLVEIQKVFACAKASKKKNVFIIERRVKNIFFSRSPKGNFLLGLLFNRNLVNSPTLGFENIEITSFQDGFLQIRNTKKRCSFLVIENTEETIKKIYDFCNWEYFDHDLNNIMVCVEHSFHRVNIEQR